METRNYIVNYESPVTSDAMFLVKASSKRQAWKIAVKKADGHRVLNVTAESKHPLFV